MKKHLWVLFIAALFAVPGIYAQEERGGITIPELTLEQKYMSAEVNSIALMVTTIAYAKSKGDTAEDIGEFLGKQIAKNWNPGNRDPLMVFVRGMNWNMNLFKDFKMEILEYTGSFAQVKWNREWERKIGNPERFAVTLEELHILIEQVFTAIANHLELEYKQETKEDAILVEVRKK